MDQEIKFCDFDKICRVCLYNKKDLFDINTLNIKTYIEACSSVQIPSSDDNFPQQICQECFQKLEDAFLLRQLCEDSNRRLQELTEMKCELQPSEQTETFDDEDDIKLSSLRESSCVDVKTELYNTDSWEGNGHDLDDTRSYNSGEENSADSTEERPNRKRNPVLYKCDLCEKSLDGVWRLALHMRKKHKAEPIKCSECDEQFYHKLHLQDHLTNHDQKLLTCKECYKQYPTLAKLKKHQVAHRPEMFHCFQCDCSFKGRFMLTKHMQIYHSGQRPRDECKICGKSVIRTNMKVHMRIHQERTPFECEECPKKFVRRITLVEHVMKIHRNEQIPLKQLCNICGRAFRGKAEIKRHMRSHTGEKPFPCELCEKRYREAKALRRHVSSAHLNERPFICEICTKAFHTKAILQSHMRTHTGERPFVCLVCNKAFGSKTWLRAHLKGHVEK